MTPFSELLERYLERRGLSQAEFSRRVKVSPSVISKVMRNRSVPRWKRGESWADALLIHGAEREEFLDALHLAASPPRIPTLVSRLEHRLKSR